MESRFKEALPLVVWGSWVAPHRRPPPCDATQPAKRPQTANGLRRPNTSPEAPGALAALAMTRTVSLRLNRRFFNGRITRGNKGGVQPLAEGSHYPVRGDKTSVFVGTPLQLNRPVS